MKRVNIVKVRELVRCRAANGRALGQTIRSGTTTNHRRDPSRMTTTNFDSHAGDGEALAANGGTSLDLDLPSVDLSTAKLPSPRQGHPLKKVKKYGSLNK